MKYTEFLHTIETEITARLDNDFKLTIHPVKKNNGMIYDGLVIINPKFNIAPTIYLNPEILDYEGKKLIHIHILPSAEVHSYKKVIYDTMISSQLKILT